MMTDDAQTTDNAAPVEESAKKTKKKPRKTPKTQLLCAVEQDAQGNVLSLKPVQSQPDTGDYRSFQDYKRAVRRALEQGDDKVACDEYNGRRLTVVAFPPPFCFQAEIKEEVIRKTHVTEG